MMEIDQENDNSVQNRTSQQRKLNYRNLLNRIEDIQENEDLSNLRTVNELGHILKSANRIDSECDITERVANADETLLDANVLSAAGSLLVKCLENVDIFTSTYDADDFCEKLKESIEDPENEEPEPPNLLKLMDTARDIIFEQPTCSFLYGTYNFTKLPEPREKKQRKREVPEKLVTKHLQQVTRTEKEEEGIMDTINFFVKVLQEECKNNNDRPLDYYDFLSDSDNFTLTVENIFHCSFLLRDGKAKFDVDEKNRVTLVPTNKKDLKRFRNTDGANTQIITSISMDAWQKLGGKEGIIQRHKKQ